MLRTRDVPASRQPIDGSPNGGYPDSARHRENQNLSRCDPVLRISRTLNATRVPADAGFFRR
jgi:hypothetical protein